MSLIGGFSKSPLKFLSSGLNTFLREQKKVVDPNCKLTVAQFDTTYELVQDGVNLADAREIVLKPRGMTALFDAVGNTLTTVQARKPEGTVTVMIVTDGMENASVEWDGCAIKKLCEECTAQGWELLYLGAEVDAFAGAAGLGIHRSRTVNFNKTSRSVNNVFAETSANVARRRMTGGPTQYSPAQREAIKKGEGATTR
jgi:hypothetical protein